MSLSYFSQNYTDARRRFCQAALKLNAQLISYPIVVEKIDDLAIDVAIIGNSGDSTVVISSGVHGVEGFFGSAVQLAVLHRLARLPPAPGIRYVFVHAVNPFGFSQLRRVNEKNVDLNRNFLSEKATYAGAPVGYIKLNHLLNPQTAPSDFELFNLKVLWNIARYGFQNLKQAVAGGQYEFPQGLFFGGAELSQSAEVVQHQCDGWIGDAPQVIHVDLHSGLGRFAEYKLLLTRYDKDRDWYARAFGAEYLESSDSSAKTAYVVTGLMGDWLQQHFSNIKYRFVVAEFGTYQIVRGLQTLRLENYSHHFSDSSSSAFMKTKADLLEMFCPRSDSWRRHVVESGVRIVQQAVESLGTY